MNVINYFESDCQLMLIEKIGRSDWGAAKFLVSLLQRQEFEKTLGSGSLFLLMDGGNLVSFVTLTRKDCIDDDTLYPWLGFFFTFPEYRGNRYGGRLLSYAAAEAAKRGYEKVFLATDHIGLYEKYGFIYAESRVDVYGEDSRIYVKVLQERSER